MNAVSGARSARSSAVTSSPVSWLRASSCKEPRTNVRSIIGIGGSQLSQTSHHLDVRRGGRRALAQTRLNRTGIAHHDMTHALVAELGDLFDDLVRRSHREQLFHQRAWD